jgi:hypothetical protein
MPQKYLARKTTTCGTIQAIEFDSNFHSFRKQWDFRKLAKPKLDGIINYTCYKKIHPLLKKLEDIVLSSRYPDTIQDKLIELIK